MKKKPYAGILAKETSWPIGRNPVGKEKDVILGVLRDKLTALLDHYGIEGGLDDPANGWKLALCLAGDHVKEFAPVYRRPSKPPHRPHELRAGARDIILCLELTHAKLEGRSVLQTADKLAQRWQAQGKSNASGATLYRKYFRLRKEIEAHGVTPGMIDAARVLNRGH